MTAVIINKPTADYIRAHRHDDVRLLALHPSASPDVDMTAALQQIAGWQTACRKLPSWAAVEGIVYPARLSMEQCSGERAARYKQSVVRRLTAASDRDSMYDLTGGAGVDFSFIAPLFDHGCYVERQERLCDIARHNMPLLGVGNARFVCADAADCLRSIDHAALIFLDPARRDVAGRRTYAISDCTPDILSMKDLLLSKADMVMVKLSPMLDISKTVDDLNGNGPGVVSELHIVAVNNECKELLAVLSADNTSPVRVFCANGDDVFSFSRSENITAMRDVKVLSPTLSCGMYLYEPDASVMKAGCFALLCRRFGVMMTDRNSHLFVSERLADGFPGRKFRITAVSTMNRKELKTALCGITKANISVRNFPLTAARLRSRLRLSDGGDTYIFATTAAGRHVVVIASKLTPFPSSRKTDQSLSVR